MILPGLGAASKVSSNSSSCLLRAGFLIRQPPLPTDLSLCALQDVIFELWGFPLAPNIALLCASWPALSQAFFYLGGTRTSTFLASSTFTRKFFSFPITDGATGSRILSGGAAINGLTSCPALCIDTIYRPQCRLGPPSFLSQRLSSWRQSSRYASLSLSTLLSHPPTPLRSLSFRLGLWLSGQAVLAPTQTRILILTPSGCSAPILNVFISVLETGLCSLGTCIAALSLRDLAHGCFSRALRSGSHCWFAFACLPISSR